jgi:integrase/recombinase XerD
VSVLRERAEEYLRMRRALGYKLEVQGWLLGEFIAYLEQASADTVTIEHALAWATLPASTDRSYWAQRLLRTTTSLGPTVTA